MRVSLLNVEISEVGLYRVSSSCRLTLHCELASLLYTLKIFFQKYSTDLQSKIGHMSDMSESSTQMPDTPTCLTSDKECCTAHNKKATKKIKLFVKLRLHINKTKRQLQNPSQYCDMASHHRYWLSLQRNHLNPSEYLQN